MGILIQKLLKKGVIDQSRANFLEERVKEKGKEEEVILEADIIDENSLFKMK